ncbi:hypothetical protein P700755_000940 [Psychroflexus torquis ATCC 700755]|uniref:Uncharacterized protein n=1 Tax=Psychroflexus torquis (strain ATCC 700755 / CIP 106069 / ACAM 623) TaxID=313595 RepID=K4IFR1_PSYTT|nr:hypothetical protein [Psychroflexus torquis]AFU67916.1 hypothetical protein P700755_000940 [Psychroflexus torquis ATCC 700755]
MEFKKNKSFVDGVKENDLKMVKSQLSEMIMLFQGNIFELKQAVEYAENNCSFKFEGHLETETEVIRSSNSDFFYAEKVELRSNFSRERFNEVIRLYPLMVEKDNFFGDNPEEDLTDVNRKNGVKLNTKTYLLIGASIIVSGYILYRLFR